LRWLPEALAEAILARSFAHFAKGILSQAREPASRALKSPTFFDTVNEFHYGI
jgi:hypothetical protein